MALNPRNWRNADGLNVWFGPAEGRSGNGGEQRTNGDTRVLQQVINLTDLGTTAAFIDTHNGVPKGAFVESVEIETLVAATSGGSATLSIGLKQSDESTNISDAALVSAAALATFAAAGTKLTLTTGVTGAGDKIGTAIVANGLITAKYATAAFTAGKIIVRTYYNFVA